MKSSRKSLNYYNERIEIMWHMVHKISRPFFNLSSAQFDHKSKIRVKIRPFVNLLELRDETEERSTHQYSESRRAFVGIIVVYDYFERHP